MRVDMTTSSKQTEVTALSKFSQIVGWHLPSFEVFFLSGSEPLASYKNI
jgi:hypothetical protein